MDDAEQVEKMKLFLMVASKNDLIQLLSVVKDDDLKKVINNIINCTF